MSTIHSVLYVGKNEEERKQLEDSNTTIAVVSDDTQISKTSTFVYDAVYFSTFDWEGFDQSKLYSMLKLLKPYGILFLGPAEFPTGQSVQAKDLRIMLPIDFHTEDVNLFKSKKRFVEVGRKRRFVISDNHETFRADLRSKAWLTDITCNAYIELMLNFGVHQSLIDVPAVAIDIAQTYDFNMGFDQISQQKKQNRYRRMIDKQKKINPKDVQVFCFPINFANSHWACVFYDVRHNEFHFFDSLKSSTYQMSTPGVKYRLVVQDQAAYLIRDDENPFAQNMLEVLKGFFEEYLKETSIDFDKASVFENGELTVKNGKLPTGKDDQSYDPPPQQNDAHNCGVFMLQTINCVVQQKPFNAIDWNKPISLRDTMLQELNDIECVLPIAEPGAPVERKNSPGILRLLESTNTASEEDIDSLKLFTRNLQDGEKAGAKEPTTTLVVVGMTLGDAQSKLSDILQMLIKKYNFDEAETNKSTVILDHSEHKHATTAKINDATVYCIDSEVTVDKLNQTTFDLTKRIAKANSLFQDLNCTFVDGVLFSEHCRLNHTLLPNENHLKINAIVLSPEIQISPETVRLVQKINNEHVFIAIQQGFVDPKTYKKPADQHWAWYCFPTKKIGKNDSQKTAVQTPNDVAFLVNQVDTELWGKLLVNFSTAIELQGKQNVFPNEADRGRIDAFVELWGKETGRIAKILRFDKFQSFKKAVQRFVEAWRGDRPQAKIWSQQFANTSFADAARLAWKARDKRTRGETPAALASFVDLA